MNKSNKIPPPPLIEWEAAFFASLTARKLTELVKATEPWLGFSMKDGFDWEVDYLVFARVELILNEFAWEESDQVIANIKRNLK